jgi:homoserine kinase
MNMTTSSLHELCPRSPRPLLRARGRLPPRCACASDSPSSHNTRAAAHGPPTIANLGPGFDWLGVAVEGCGDVVEAQLLDASSGPSVHVGSISGDDGKLSLDADSNCAAVAALHALYALDADVSIELDVMKGLPLGSGLGSSAASAAAAATAVASLIAKQRSGSACDNGNSVSMVDPELLVPAGIEAEACVSGRHADNVAPALMGGFVLIQQTQPPHVRRLRCGCDDSLHFALVTPDQEAPTAKMRRAVPDSVSVSEHVLGAASGGGLVAGILEGNVQLLGESLASDRIIEAARAPLLPGFLAAKHAAVEAGAAGCTISGAGPTAVAVAENKRGAELASKAMADAFEAEGKGVVSAIAAPLSEGGAQPVPIGSRPELSDEVLTVV